MNGVAVLRAVFNTWGWITNLATIIVIFMIIHRDRKRFKATDFVILNLAISDFMFSFIDAVTAFATNGDLTRLSPSECSAKAYLTGLPAMASIYSTVLLGYVRYRIMKQNPDKPKLRFRQVVKLQIASWLVGFVYATFYVSADIILQIPDYCHHLIGLSTPTIAIATLYAFILTFFPPFVLLALYVKVYYEAVVAEKIINSSTRKRASSAVARMGLCVLGTYCVTIIPWSASIVYTMALGADAVISEAFASALGFFYIVSFGINPIFYFSFIRTYRDALIDLLHLRAFTSRMRSSKSTSVDIEKVESTTMQSLGSRDESDQCKAKQTYSQNMSQNMEYNV